MAIRIRVVDGVTVALCAAKTFPEEGDIYLDVNAHHALYEKFGSDFVSEGQMDSYSTDEEIRDLMVSLEIEDNGG